MKIFNTLEEEAFESPPEFNSGERKRFFSLSLLLKESQASLRTPTNKVCFLVAAGYFKARRKFFARQFRSTDIEYVARQIGVNLAEVHVDAYSKGTYARHQRVILNYFGCKPFDEKAQAFTAGEIAPLIRVQLRPKLVLVGIIQLLTRKKIEIPSYNVLADMIVTALNQHQRALNEVIDDWLGATQRAKLDELLEKEPADGTDEGWRYHLTLLKRPFQSTRPSKIRANLADLDTLPSLYLDLRPVVERLNLSCEPIRYYAYSVIKAQIPQVSRRADARPLSASYRVRRLSDLQTQRHFDRHAVERRTGRHQCRAERGKGNLFSGARTAQPIFFRAGQSVEKERQGDIILNPGYRG